MVADPHLDPRRGSIVYELFPTTMRASKDILISSLSSGA